MDFHKPIAYLIAGIIVYFTLTYSSQGRISNNDLIFFTVIAVLIFAIVENVYTLVPGKDDATRCRSYCVREPFANSNVMREHLENVSTSYPVPQTPVMSAMQNCGNKTDYENYRCAKDMMEKSQTAHNLNYVDGDDLMSRKDDGSYTVTLHRNPQAPSVGNRPDHDVISNEMKYSYYDHNILPPNVNSNAYEPGFSYLPPSEWFRRSPHPPLCVSEKRCSVCPNLTTGSNPDLKEWGSCRRVMPPDAINVNYITEKLNSGR